MNRFGIQLCAAVALRPFQNLSCGEGLIMHLASGKACLNFHISAVAGAGEKFLPAVAAAMVAPAEHLVIQQRCGGTVIENVAVLVCAAFPCGLYPFGRLEEIVKGAARVAGIGEVPLHHGEIGEFFVGQVVADHHDHVGGGENAGLSVLGDGNVGPPVGGGIGPGGVLYLDVGEKLAGACGKVEVRLPYIFLCPLKLIDTDEFLAVFILQNGRPDVVAGEIGVANGAEVPFDAAGEPCIADGKVARLQNGVCHKELAVLHLVKE